LEEKIQTKRKSGNKLAIALYSQPIRGNILAIACYTQLIRGNTYATVCSSQHQQASYH